MSKLRYKEGGIWKSIAPSQKEFDDNKAEVAAQLAETEKAIKPYNYTNYGIAFDSSDPSLIAYDNHASWTHGTVSYDVTDDKVVFFYDLKPVHSNSNIRVLMRKKDVNGGFSNPVVVADKLSTGISCKTQSAGITKNGDYLVIVWEWNGTTSGAHVYRSVDKGNTWSRNATPISTADINGFLVLKSGRILIHQDAPSVVKYSDNNGLTWTNAQPFDLAHLPSQAIVEPAWCELSDGTIVAYYRENTGYDVKNPALFTKSIDGGLTWTKPIDSTSIVDFVNSNGQLIFHEDTKAVEFIHHSRFMQADGYASLYVSVAKENDVKNDKFGEQIRIDKLSPQGKPVYGGTGDGGYIGVAKDKYGTLHVLYYNGISTRAQICYMTGKKAKENTNPISIDSYTGEKIKYGLDILNTTFSTSFESGGINIGVGLKDSYNVAANRLRLKKHSIVVADTAYKIDLRNPNMVYSIRQYDKDLLNLSDTGLGLSGVTSFKTLSNARYVKLLVKKVDDTAITANEVYGVLHSNLFNLDKPSVLVSEVLESKNSMYVVASKTATQSVPNAANTQIIFDTVSLSNNANYIEIDVPTSQLKVTETGIYEVILNASYAFNATGSRQIFIQDLNYAINQNAVTASSTPTRMQSSVFLSLTAGSLLSLVAYQTSGVAIDITTASRCLIRKIASI